MGRIKRGMAAVAAAAALLWCPLPEAMASPGKDTPAVDRNPARVGPYRLATLLDAPTWLEFKLSHRTRYGHTFNQFRAGRAGDDPALSLRTLFWAQVNHSGVRLGAELQDSRIYATDDNAPVNTALANAVELLRAYVGLDFDDLFVRGDRTSVDGGRLTLTAGSRRLLHRNRFRNTINSFTGVDAHWRSPDGHAARILVTLPVERRPRSADELSDNEIEFDRESGDVLFWGLFYSGAPDALGATLELYLFGLHERDSSDRPTRNRQLYTPGLRMLRRAEPGRLDFEIEAIAQFGQSRKSSASDDTEDLDHRAFFQHVSLGYTFAVPSQPRLSVQYDFASGDSDPTDDRNGRFDSLFGVPRFEYGPTGVFRAFSRENISSPGTRLELRPHANVEAFVHYRAFWLASRRDAWTASGVVDPTGMSGTFIGQQIEFRLGWNVLPKNIRLEVGGAHLFRGKFAKGAPNANGNGDSTYLFSQAILEI